MGWIGGGGRWKNGGWGCKSRDEGGGRSDGKMGWIGAGVGGRMEGGAVRVGMRGGEKCWENGVDWGGGRWKNGGWGCKSRDEGGGRSVGKMGWIGAGVGGRMEGGAVRVGMRGVESGGKMGWIRAGVGGRMEGGAVSGMRGVEKCWENGVDWGGGRWREGML